MSTQQSEYRTPKLLTGVLFGLAVILLIGGFFFSIYRNASSVPKAAATVIKPQDWGLATIVSAPIKTGLFPVYDLWQIPVRMNDFDNPPTATAYAPEPLVISHNQGATIHYYSPKKWKVGDVVRIGSMDGKAPAMERNTFQPATTYFVTDYEGPPKANP